MTEITSKSLAGKLVVVTGGGRGIGQAIALGCAREGARIIITARSSAELKETAEHIREHTGTTCIPVTCDVSNPKDTQLLQDAIRSAGGELYGLICAAGVYGSIGSFAETPFEEWTKAIEVNLIGTARTIHGCLPYLRKSTHGRVVLFSGGGQAAMPHFSAYTTSKGGIWRLTETLGAELAEQGIFLNSIAPGAINTRLLDDLLEAGPEKTGAVFYQKSLEQKKKGGESPEKAVNLCLYLLSEKSKGLYGKTISAVWDDYQNIQDPEALSHTDIYCMRRVVDARGGTRAN